MDWFDFVYIDLCANLLLVQVDEFEFGAKALLYAGYMQYIIHAVGSAILSAPAGMIGAIALAAVMKPANEVETID